MSMTTTSTNPTHQLPVFDALNNIELVAGDDSKILGVSVYSGRAEVTRLFKFDVKTGQNQVVITGLPNVLDQQSFRVEGRGSATIHDVAISSVERPPPPITSPKLDQLQTDLGKVTKGLARAVKAVASIEAYIASLNAQNVDASKLQDIVDTYDDTAGKLDAKITELEKKKTALEKEAEEERKLLNGRKFDDKLGLKATIGVFAGFEGQVEIALIYAVTGASWSAAYDVRVDMQTKDKPVTLNYKGAIAQSTGEDWTDVPITLETASPTFGVNIPSLSTWTLSVARPVYYKSAKKSKGFGGGGSRREVLSDTHAILDSSTGDYPYGNESCSGDLEHRGLKVSSKGNVTATFTVPGLMSVPSDGVAHNVTIVKLKLDAELEWVSVPKSDLKVHLKAKVTNASEYTLLNGPASVYVDGSFIARSDLPPVSPDETFDCPLGLDPSIRITYAPISKKSTQVGFMSKSRVQTYTQRITVHNTKSSSVENVKVIDQIPISEEAVITVKLLSPSQLQLPDNAKNAGTISKVQAPTSQGPVVENKLGVKVPAPVKVAPGVVVQWEGVEDIASEADLGDLGSDGKLGWVCSVQAGAKIGLTLQWEITAPVGTNISGL